MSGKIKPLIAVRDAENRGHERTRPKGGKHRDEMVTTAGAYHRAFCSGTQRLGRRRRSRHAVSVTTKRETSIWKTNSVDTNAQPLLVKRKQRVRLFRV